jgi:photoactive yellow protein
VSDRREAGQPAPQPALAGIGPFADPGLLDTLESASLDVIDDFGFGLIVMDRDGRVLGYNQAESKLSGLPADEVIGRNFFVEIGPCTNNYLVAQRYQDSASQDSASQDSASQQTSQDSEELDEQLDYVFTYRMAPTPVRLRLLARPGSPRQYLAVVLR